MKVEANKQVVVTCQRKVDFDIGKKLEIEMSNGITMDLEEHYAKTVIKMKEPYLVVQKNPKELLIYKELKPKNKKPKPAARVDNIKDYINWSEVSRLLTGNPSTISKNYISQKNALRVEDLLDAVNEWVLKNL